MIHCDIGTIYKSLSLKHFVVLGNVIACHLGKQCHILGKYVHRNDRSSLEEASYHPHRVKSICTHCMLIKVAPVVVRVFQEV